MCVHCWRIVKLRPCVFVRINSIEHFKTSASKTHSSQYFTVKQLLPLSFQTCVSTLQRQLFFIEAGFILHCNSFVILTFNLICIPLIFSTSYQHNQSLKFICQAYHSNKYFFELSKTSNTKIRVNFDFQVFIELTINISAWVQVLSINVRCFLRILVKMS